MCSLCVRATFVRMLCVYVVCVHLYGCKGEAECVLCVCECARVCMCVCVCVCVRFPLVYDLGRGRVWESVTERGMGEGIARTCARVYCDGVCVFNN